MSIYTRYGDQGYTRLVGGGRAKKNAPRVQAYGSIDTLNSHAGVAVSQLSKEDPVRKELLQVQQWIFDCGGDFATPDEKRPYKIEAEMVQWLEEKIDEYWSKTPELKQFILPGGVPAAATLHVCRCVAREAERNAVALLELEEAVNPEALKFLNRLSDYFFALARWVNLQAEEPDVCYQNSAPVFKGKKKPRA
ncbi:cob(I)yrinic acid a,c-diamide adenosyltransferase [Enterococcus sp. 669A]|uniref:Corrinoid adenosyltransferase n=1 Tax=Candidatus Enterococcus moelleringii TaxID=2815325 RepID=A0ABS3LEE8_9ENTE|nr:cob(I)yrinic acid a,c-diamide adenosyltransferase [Enterococcus sp. 669A]MBO1307994.1 cob(I)yrinic acid a,c-diamide adenosyltransferase [Enterococcus sp. 669A]